MIKQNIEADLEIYQSRIKEYCCNHCLISSTCELKCPLRILKSHIDFEEEWEDVGIEVGVNLLR